MLAIANGNQIVKEPVIREADPENTSDGLLADLAVRGLWYLQAEALIDIRADAESYRHHSVEAVIKLAEIEKKIQ